MATKTSVGPLCSRYTCCPESAFHRIWSCKANCGAVAYERSGLLLAQECAQHEADEAIWLRGLLPADRAQVTAPPEDDSWWAVDYDDGVFTGCLGAGSQQRLILLFGDARG
eukprot:7888516-Pyramimonas_sp.AAC.1